MSLLRGAACFLDTNEYSRTPSLLLFCVKHEAGTVFSVGGVPFDCLQALAVGVEDGLWVSVLSISGRRPLTTSRIVTSKTLVAVTYSTVLRNPSAMGAMVSSVVDLISESALLFLAIVDQKVLAGWEEE
ncbi:unnamed protein product [Toxocara canis]|uniref:Proteasome assembly chaperone 3 n=1 Tax=Toxocara canis TaxID=6265 RepID=A0A183VD47_TOXCA|nr:unnamed protein product [Toxocara canis]